MEGKAYEMLYNFCSIIRHVNGNRHKTSDVRADVMYLISKLVPLSILICLISVGACAFNMGNRSQNAVDWAKVHSTLDHCMAKDAQSRPPFDPIEKTNLFLTTDIRAISWLRLGFVFGVHQIEWQWYSPDGKIQFKDSAQIEDPNHGQGEYWENYTASSQLPIKGNPYENLTGNWRVEVYQDGEKIFTEDFQLVTSQSLGDNDGLAGNSDPLNIQFQTEAVDPINKCVYYTRDNQGRQLFKIRVHAVGPDLSKIKSIEYVLHETFEHPEYTSSDASNDFEMVLWTWGSFSMPIKVATIEGRQYNYTYPFTFRNKLVEAQNEGIRFIEVKEIGS